VHFTQEQILEMLLPLKERAREKAREFGEQPIGKVVRVAGRCFVKAQAEGRGVTIHDVKAVVDEMVSQGVEGLPK